MKLELDDAEHARLSELLALGPGTGFLCVESRMNWASDHLLLADMLAVLSPLGAVAYVQPGSVEAHFELFVKFDMYRESMTTLRQELMAEMLFACGRHSDYEAIIRSSPEALDHMLKHKPIDLPLLSPRGTQAMSESAVAMARSIAAEQAARRAVRSLGLT